MNASCRATAVQFQTVKSTPKPQMFDLQALLWEVATVFHAAAHARPVHVLFDIDPMLPRYLLGKATSLKQLLFCLGGNAIQATAQGEITVAVEVEQMTATSVSLIFSLRDTGNGNVLHEPAIDFNPSTADGAIIRRFGGTAEGLEECLRLVDAMGGELELMSPARGAGQFQLSLNMRRDKTRPTTVSFSNTACNNGFL